MGCSQGRPMRVLVIGLDNSGKSTIVNLLKPESEKKTDIAATVGLQVENFRLEAFKGLKCTMFDMSGAGADRNLWEHYYSECNGVAFVIDSADQKRLPIVKEEITQMLSHEDMDENGSPILFLANKMDLTGAKTPNEIRKLLQLEKLKTRPWRIFATNALKGDGVLEGMAWLQKQIG